MTVAVVGSANLDLVIRTPVRAAPGETVMGTDYSELVGGKGANQAIAAAAHAPTAFVGTVGGDDAGCQVREALRRAGADAAQLRTVAGPTGRAAITVTPDGENDIVVLPLATAALTAEHVTAALDELRPEVVLTQLEIPEAATEAVGAWCDRRPGIRLVLNPSPVRALPPALIARADPLIVNETEAREVLGERGAGLASDEALAKALAGLSRSVVLTRGARGALVAQGDAIDDIPGVPVARVIDTTGAGDAFAGTLAARLAAGDTLLAAAHTANAAAADAVATPRASRNPALP